MRTLLLALALTAAAPSAFPQAPLSREQALAALESPDAARRAEGIVWQLRSNLGGPHPLGPVDVLVDDADLDTARELLDPARGSRVDDHS